MTLNSQPPSTAIMPRVQPQADGSFALADRANGAALATVIEKYGVDDAAKPNQPGAVLTEQETAAYLKLQINTLRKWRREGGGPRYIRCGGRLIRYIKADIDDWLNKNTFSSHAAELRAHQIK